MMIVQRNPGSRRALSSGLANRRLQPLGHLSGARNPYEICVSASNLPPQIAHTRGNESEFPEHKREHSTCGAFRSAPHEKTCDLCGCLWFDQHLGEDWRPMSCFARGHG